MEIPVERMPPQRDVHMGRGDAERVVRTPVRQPGQFGAGIGVDMDQIAVGRLR